MEQSYNKLFVNNRKWVAEKLTQNKNYFKELAMGQSPKYLFIGCSDSRVPANEITGTAAGEMFIHRNIANLVVHTDMNVMSVLQYAVEVLKVEHIIVCGHYGCGGIKAALTSEHYGIIDTWLSNIKDVYRLYRDEFASINDEEMRHQKLVELNVREQVYKICTTSIVQNAWKHDQKLEVHGWVYDIREGLLNDLKIDTQINFKDIDAARFRKSST